MKVRASIWPSNIFFDAITEDNAFVGADDAGIQDDPIPQSLYYSNTQDRIITFINDGGTLKRAEQGTDPLYSYGISITGNPSVFGSTLFYISGGTVYRRTITDATFALGSPTTVITPALDPLAVHAVSATKCVVVCDGDGGLKILLANGGAVWQENRFMFPRLFDYTDTST